MKKIFGNGRVGRVLWFVAIFALAVGGAFWGYRLVKALSVGDTFSDATKVALTWHTTVDTGAGVARLMTKSCDSGAWDCTDTTTCANDLGDGDYILVAHDNLAVTYQWKTSSTACDRPQCGQDGGQDGDNLVADNTVSFSGYSARDACKSAGGRLPTKTELSCMYTNKATYEATTGHNFQSSYYWSSTEGGTDYAWYVYFYDGFVGNSNKGYTDYVRCVLGY